MSQLPPTHTVYLFDQDQLAALLVNTIDTYLYLRDFQSADLARPGAVRELINHLDIERGLSAEDDGYIATQQIIPVMATIVPDNE